MPVIQQQPAGLDVASNALLGMQQIKSNERISGQQLAANRLDTSSREKVAGMQIGAQERMGQQQTGADILRSRVQERIAKSSQGMQLQLADKEMDREQFRSDAETKRMEINQRFTQTMQTSQQEFAAEQNRLNLAQQRAMGGTFEQKQKALLEIEGRREKLQMRMQEFQTARQLTMLAMGMKMKAADRTWDAKLAESTKQLQIRRTIFDEGVDRAANEGKAAVVSLTGPGSTPMSVVDLKRDPANMRKLFGEKAGTALMWSKYDKLSGDELIVLQAKLDAMENALTTPVAGEKVTPSDHQKRRLLLDIVGQYKTELKNAPGNLQKIASYRSGMEISKLLSETAANGMASKDVVDSIQAKIAEIYDRLGINPAGS